MRSVIQYNKSRKHKILFGSMRIFNPFPKHLKLRMDGKYVLDMRTSLLSKMREKKELKKRLKEKEEGKCTSTRKKFQVSLKGSVEMHGSNT